MFGFVHDGGDCREWQSFSNSGRTDGLRLSHWAKAGPDPEAGMRLSTASKTI